MATKYIDTSIFSNKQLSRALTTPTMFSAVDKNGNKLPMFDHTNSLESFLSRYQVSNPHSEQINTSRHGSPGKYKHQVLSNSDDPHRHRSSSDHRSRRLQKPAHHNRSRPCSKGPEETVRSRTLVKEKGRYRTCEEGSSTPRKCAEELSQSRTSDGYTSPSNDRIFLHKIREGQTLRYNNSVDNANVRANRSYDKEQYLLGSLLEEQHRSKPRFKEESRHKPRNEGSGAMEPSEEILCRSLANASSGESHSPRGRRVSSDVRNNSPMAGRGPGCEVGRDRQGWSSVIIDRRERRSRSNKQPGRRRASDCGRGRRSTSHDRHGNQSTSDERPGTRSTSDEVASRRSTTEVRSTHKRNCALSTTGGKIDTFITNSDGTNGRRSDGMRNQKRPSGLRDTRRKGPDEKHPDEQNIRKIPGCNVRLNLSKGEPLVRPRSKEGCCKDVQIDRRRPRCDLDCKEGNISHGGGLETRGVRCRHSGHSKATYSDEEPQELRRNKRCVDHNRNEGLPKRSAAAKRVGHNKCESHGRSCKNEAAPISDSGNRHAGCVCENKGGSIAEDVTKVSTSECDRTDNADNQTTEVDRGPTCSAVTGGKDQGSSVKPDVDECGSPERKLDDRKGLNFFKNARYDVSKNEFNILSDDDETIIVYIPPKRGKDGRRKSETLHFCDDRIIYNSETDDTPANQKQ